MCYKKRKLKNRILADHRSGFDKEYIKVPCGTCPACRKVKSNDWLVRSYFEFLENEHQAFFVSLDFDDEHLPRWFGIPCFDSEIMKHFLYRLRNTIGSFRYFYATDYGGLLRRPHYHIVIIPEKEILLPVFSSVIRDKWQQGRHSDIELLPCVDHNKLKAVEYVCSYSSKDITWDTEIFKKVSDKPIPPRFRPRCQASKGFGLRAFENGLIKSEDFLKDGVVGLPIGKNGKIVSFPIPRYYEMKLCYDYSWDKVNKKASLIKNDFGVEVCKHRHNRCYDYQFKTFVSSKLIDIHNRKFFTDTIFSGQLWSEVVDNCLVDMDDFKEFIYYRPFISYHNGNTVFDSVRNDVLCRPSWTYYEAAFSAFEQFQQEINDVQCEISINRLVDSAKRKARKRIEDNIGLYRHLQNVGFDFSKLY